MSNGPSWQPDAKYQVSVDFDGVIHSYTTKWIDAATIPDPPVEGAIEWLHEISKQFDIVIHTTRAKGPDGVQAVADYLKEHGFDMPVKITCVKEPSLVYVDDRAYRFDGTNFPTAENVRNLVPWNKR